MKNLILIFTSITSEARTTTSHTTEVQQNGIPEEAESATTPQPQVASNQEYPVYEPTVDHVTSEPVADEVETEQFTPTEVESKSEWTMSR